MPIIYFATKTELGSKRLASAKKKDLTRRGWSTTLVNKREGKKIAWGVKYW